MEIRGLESYSPRIDEVEKKHRKKTKKIGGVSGQKKDSTPAPVKKNLKLVKQSRKKRKELECHLAKV